MSVDESAFVSGHAQVLTDWQDYLDRRAAWVAECEVLKAEFGRELMGTRGGWGHSETVDGFALLDGEKPGSELADGVLRVPLRGTTNMAGPNLRRRAGKDLAARLSKLRLSGPALSGMPPFKLVGTGLGMSMQAPQLLHRDDRMWVRWGTTGVEVDPEFWSPAPLSQFHAAHEAHQAEVGQ